MNASEKWKQDADRLEKLKNLGYNVIVIWESEFKNNTKLFEEIFGA